MEITNFPLENITFDNVLVIAVIGWLFAILQFLLGKFHEKNIRKNLTRIEMIKVIEEWVKNIAFFVTFIYEGLSKHKLGVNTRKAQKSSSIDEFINNISVIDSKIVGISKSQELKTLFNRRRIDKLFKNINMVENLLEYRVMPLDIKLQHENQRQKESLATETEIELVSSLSQINTLIEVIQEIIWQEKMGLS
jgi:hypothetical protein